MALRDENYFFSRRIADRGSDEIVFDSQDRKIQETDPMDVIWDEIVGKEEHPEEGDGYKFQEGNSEAFIRNENFGKEYLGSCSTLYPTPPRFDHYRDERESEEEITWIMKALNGVANQEGEPLRMINFSYKSDQGNAGAMGGVMVDNDDDTVTTGSDSVFRVTHAAHNVDGEGSLVALGEVEIPARFLKVCLETHSLISVDTFDLTNCPLISEFQIGNHISYAIMVAHGDSVACGNTKDVEGYTTARGGDESVVGFHAKSSMDLKNYKDLIFLKNHVSENFDNYANISCRLTKEALFSENKNGSNITLPYITIYIEKGAIKSVGFVNKPNQQDDNTHGDEIETTPKIVILNGEFVHKNAWGDDCIAKLDLKDKPMIQNGGLMQLSEKKGLESSDAYAPFDPGGFVLKTKLEDEFFRRRGV